MNYAFKSQNGECPACIAFGQRWYIKDRFLHGDEYEYCLMSVPIGEQIVYHFKNLKEVAGWLNEEKNNPDYDEELTNILIRRWTVTDCSDKALLEKNGITYILDKVKYTLTIPHKASQKSGWFDSYNECLNIAKDILSKLEEKQNGKQISLFD